MKEVEAGNLILGLPNEEDGFVVVWNHVRIHLSIRPITTRTLIRISREIAQIKTIEHFAFEDQLKAAEDLKHICRAIAIATGTPFVWLIARVIASLEMQHLVTLWKIIVKNSDPTSFFFIMVSAKGMNRLKTEKEPEQPEAETASSDSLP